MLSAPLALVVITASVAHAGWKFHDKNFAVWLKTHIDQTITGHAASVAKNPFLDQQLTGGSGPCAVSPFSDVPNQPAMLEQTPGGYAEARNLLFGLVLKELLQTQDKTETLTTIDLSKLNALVVHRTVVAYCANVAHQPLSDDVANSMLAHLKSQSPALNPILKLNNPVYVGVVGVVVEAVIKGVAAKMVPPLTDATLCNVEPKEAGSTNENQLPKFFNHGENIKRLAALVEQVSTKIAQYDAASVPAGYKTQDANKVLLYCDVVVNNPISELTATSVYKYTKAEVAKKAGKSKNQASK